MIIESLKIIKLHNLYDYDVRFNNDLTFLYGSNGCGKTTILNILESIISGRIYDLFTWEFESIKLDYLSDNNKSNDKNTIHLYHENENLCVLFQNDKHYLNKDEFVRSCEEADSLGELHRLMMAKHTFLKSIKDDFNYVYLPLNRNPSNVSNSPLYRKLMRLPRIRNYYFDLDERGFSREDEIGRAADLVKNRYVEAIAKVRIINDEFRNSVLKSLLKTNVNISDKSFVRFLLESTNTIVLDSLKDKYIGLLASLDLLDEKEKDQYIHFFKKYKNQVESLISNRKNEKNKNDFSIPLSLIYEYHEIEKIRTVIPLAQNAEEEKKKALRRINLFVDTINSFICSDDEDKRLSIDETGTINIFTKGSEKSILVNNLSSGEKQLFIFFANLVFNVDESQSSIFVVDEPELSLHLSWQKKFVEMAQNVNDNMQLIFATHAPEIVGQYRKKMVKLVKNLHIEN